GVGAVIGIERTARTDLGDIIKCPREFTEITQQRSRRDGLQGRADSAEIAYRPPSLPVKKNRNRRYRWPSLSTWNMGKREFTYGYAMAWEIAEFAGSVRPTPAS